MGVCGQRGMNGAIISASAVRQGFNTVQWVATQWRAAPDGDVEGNLAFSGVEKIAINPAFFQRLDEWVEMTFQAVWSMRP